MADLRSVEQITAADWEGGRQQLNRILARLQQGGLVVQGIRFAQRAAVPVDAPIEGQPNAVLVDVAGTDTLHVWDGSAWVVAGTQT